MSVPLNRRLKVLLRALLCVVFGLAAFHTARIATAAYFAGKGTVAGVERAIQLAPDQAENFRMLAALVGDDDPDRAKAALRRSVELDPLNSGAWIELGLRCEAGGDQSCAAQSLTRAFEVDQQFEPRWTLANYYFRRGDTQRFWHWAKLAAEISHGEPSALFRLCGKIEEDGTLIQRLGIRNPDLKAAYLTYLMSGDRIDLLMPTARELLSGNRAADTAVLLTAVERLLMVSKVKEALEIWNTLAETRKIPFGRLDPDAGISLTDGSFGADPISIGFSWRLSKEAGLETARENGEGGIRLSFSGSQPEAFEPLTQLVPLVGGARYELKFTYRASGIEKDTGLCWRVLDPIKGGAVGKSACISQDQHEGTVVFAAPQGMQLGRLSCSYQRGSGTSRIAGYVIIDRIALTMTSPAQR